MHELHTLHEQLRRIGINLNQLARQANEGRLVAPDDFARVNAEISNQMDDQKRLVELHRVFGDAGQAVAERELEAIAKYEVDQGQLLKWQQGRLKQAQERIKKNGNPTR